MSTGMDIVEELRRDPENGAKRLEAEYKAGRRCFLQLHRELEGLGAQPQQPGIGGARHTHRGSRRGRDRRGRVQRLGRTHKARQRLPGGCPCPRLRSGCHDILIENIEGFTEDDTIALSNIPRGRTAVADVVAGADPDIHHVTIRNVRGWCWRSMNLVRILSVDGGKIHDVDIDGVVELSPPGKDWRSGSAVQINDSRSEYRHKKRPETGDTRNISIANVSSCSGAAIRVFEGVENLRIENVTVTGGAETALLVKDDTIFRNCSIRGIECTETARIGSVIDLHNAHGDLSVSDVRAHSAKHVLRLSDSDIDVKLDGDKVEALSGERILRLERGDPDCGPDQPDLDSRIPVDKDGRLRSGRRSGGGGGS